MNFGTLLQNRYKIIDKLGTGGFGETYLAEDLHIPGTLKPICVVKRLKPQIMHPDIERLFEKEAEILYRLNGVQNQIPIFYAYFEENKEFYLIQELIKGHDLSKELIPSKQLSEAYVIKLLQDILQILASVHQHNVIHRDIKPSNIMRRQQDGKLVLIDFGAVKEVINTAGLTSRTIAVGTPGYMPSEQALGKPKPSSDIYAVGMVAIQALTGIMPHLLPEDNLGEVVWRDRISVSDKLAEILTKMVRYQFSQRYQSASEVLEELRFFAALPTFQFSLPAVSRLKPVEIDSKYGYRDQNGQIVIQPDFDEAGEFSEGLAAIKIGSKFGYIDETGLEVIPPKFDQAKPFSEGLASVKLGRKFGYIDQKGQFAISPQFSHCSQFSEGLAVALISKKRLGVPYIYQYGYIDKLGEVKIRPQFDKAKPFSEGLARVLICLRGGLNGCRWGYINKRGVVVIQPQFDEAGDFSEGLAWVKVGSQWGYIDKRGVVVIQPQFDEAGGFSEGLAWVKVGSKIGYINKTGIIAIQPQFDEAQDFSQGRANVRNGAQWSYINTTGNFIS
ncbi:MAG: WG repeat-containing protein [Aphanothece sp. CMT-3BRIN-NPC111]|jgi:serine/threonine-protein kinase|nr:WG repeat-containing protein [Aphanothece sp. CMT-3BRIN-NPC111]